MALSKRKRYILINTAEQMNKTMEKNNLNHRGGWIMGQGSSWPDSWLSILGSVVEVGTS